MMSKASGYTVRGVHVGVAMALFFGAVIAVNVAFSVVAMRSFPGEDVRRSYLQGLNYNETLAERRQQRALGWRASAEIATRDDGQAVLRVALTDRDGAPVDARALDGELRWPTDSRLDRVLVFEPEGAGRFAAPLGDLREGQWRLRAHAAGAGEESLDFEADMTWRTAR